MDFGNRNARCDRRRIPSTRQSRERGLAHGHSVRCLAFDCGVFFGNNRRHRGDPLDFHGAFCAFSGVLRPITVSVKLANPKEDRSAEACSNQRYTWHHSPEKSKAAVDAGHGRPEMQLHRRGRDPVGLLTKSSKVRLNYDIIKEQGGEGMQLRYHMVTIEDLMPAGHFLRKLEAALDLSFVYEETAQAKAWFSEGIPEAVRGSGASVHGAGPGERAAGGDGFHPCKGKRIPGIGVSGRSAGGARGILGAAGFL